MIDDSPERIQNGKSAPSRSAWGPVLCVLVLGWCITSLCIRWASHWHWEQDYRGFVPYGFHDSLFSPDTSRVAVAFKERCKVIDLTRVGVVTELENYSGQGLSDFSILGTIVSHFFKGEKGVSRATLWNASTGRVTGTIVSSDDKCVPVFTPDGKDILVLSESQMLIWDANTLKRKGEVNIEWSKEQWLRGVLEWSAKSHELATVNAKGQIIRIDLLHQTTTPFLPDQKNAVKSIRWSPDGTKLLSISQEEESVSVWDVQSGKSLAELPVKKVRVASFSMDGKQIVTSNLRTDDRRDEQGVPTIWNRSTKIWNAATGELDREINATGFVMLSSDWAYMVETSPKGLRIARVDGSESTIVRNWFDGHGSTCVFAPDNSYLASVNGSGRVAVWRHNDAATFWRDFWFGYKSWAIALALIGLFWPVTRRFRHPE